MKIPAFPSRSLLAGDPSTQTPVSRRQSQRGSVLLVALCFMTVLGISLASYIAVSSRTMQISNRTAQSGLSRQLAESGIDEALRAFNANNWSGWSANPTGITGGTTAWSLDTTNKRATRTLTFAATKLGQGATASIKVRVDNYDAPVLGATYQAGVTYHLNALAGHNGIWYRSVRNNNLGNTPSDTGPFTWWVPAPIHWQWSRHNSGAGATANSSDTAYALYDLVNYDGVWFRCISAVTPLTVGGTIPSLPQNWSSGSVSYSLGDVVFYSNRLYRCTTAHTSSLAALPTGGNWSTTIHWLPVIASQPWTASTSYVAGDVVNYLGAQYRCTTPTSSALFNASDWSTNLTPISFSWSSSTSYSKGSIVYYSGVWYYCRQAGSSATAPNTDTPRWVPMLLSTGAAGPGAANNAEPLFSTRYSVGDYVYRSTTWYRCIIAHVTPASPTATWNAANWTTAIPYISWAYRNFAPTYAFDELVYHGSPLWYRCIVTSTNSTPTGANWEQALSGTAHGWSSGSINYNIGDEIYWSGTLQWYRCIRAHTSSGSITPSSTAYWANTPAYKTDWQPNRQYGDKDLVRYKGLWFLSLQAGNTGNLPMAASSTWWAAAPPAIAIWDSTKTYNLDDLVSHSGTWYRCTRPHASQAPSGTSAYWSVLTGSGSTYVWDTGTTAAAGSYRSYGGAWYRCLATNTGVSPNNTTNWTSAWRQSSQAAGDAAGTPIVYAEATVTLGDGTTSRTQLRATLEPESPFPNAAAGATTLTISGGSGTVDSYDGSVRAISTAGTEVIHAYNDQTNAPFSATNPNIGWSAVLAAGNTSGTALSIGNTTVQGYAAATSSSTTPFTPLANFGSSTTVKAVNSPASPNVDLGRVSRSPYIPLFDTQPSPSLASAFSSVNFQRGRLLALTTTVNIGTPGATSPSVYYYNSDLDLGTLYTCATLNIVGPVKLYIDGRLYTRSGGAINITSTGSAEIHVDGVVRNYSGGFGFVNRTQDPKRLFVISDSTSSTTTYYIAPSNPTGLSSNPFYGVFYLPKTTTTLGLDIRTGVEVYGAVSAREITFSTEANLHYDTSLRSAAFSGIDQPYAIKEWRELPATELATMP
jgi:hypothetical protein